ncbi:MAG: response regulator transcription factor [Verrucomicrobia bacterium]|nr:response regulator transcription factor [Verrucomicrobiota bacterium]
MKVLAVEDDPVAQLVLESTLKSLGHEVVLAADGEAAWAALQDPALRVVVCDWRLPKLDGLALCRRVREEREDYVCFILLTQHLATGENLDAAFAAGVDEFLTKPVDARELKLRLHVARRILTFTTELRRLESFLPICAYCKRVRDDQAYWQEIENYVAARAGTRFSHSICPECYERVMVPQLKKLGLDSTLPAPPDRI